MIRHLLSEYTNKRTADRLNARRRRGNILTRFMRKLEKDMDKERKEPRGVKP